MSEHSREPRGNRTIIKPQRRIGWLLVVLAGCAALALALNAAWWLGREELEPAPAVAIERLEPQVAAIISAALSQVHRDNRSAMAWGDLGSVLRAHELGLEAEVCFRNAERLDPWDYRWPYLLGVSLSVSDADAALVSLRRASQRAGEQPHVHLRLAEALLDRGQSDEAAPIVERVLKSRPTDPRAQLARARVLLAAGDLEQSRAWAEKSAQEAPDKRSPQLLLAQLCRRLQDAEGQARALAALESIPEGITPWEDPDVEALLSLRQDRHARMLTADQLASSGQLADAADVLAELVQEDDPAASATLKLVQAYFQQKQFAQAEKLLRARLLENEDNELLLFQLGVACFQQQQYVPAGQAFRQVTVLKPDHVDAHYNLGHALRLSGDDAGAEQAFAAAVALRPSHAFARANLAELLLAAGRAAEAREQIQIAARLAPDDPKVHQLRLRLESQP